VPKVCICVLDVMYLCVRRHVFVCLKVSILPLSTILIFNFGIVPRLVFFVFQAEDTISKLELEYELQKQITQAADRLSQDKSVSKYVRKQRRQ
jgi:hypothetical protein